MGGNLAFFAMEVLVFFFLPLLGLFFYLFIFYGNGGGEREKPSQHQCPNWIFGS